MSEAGVLEVSRGGFPSLGVSGVCEIVAGREKVCGGCGPLSHPCSRRDPHATPNVHTPHCAARSRPHPKQLCVDASGAKPPGPLLTPPSPNALGI